MPIGNLRAIGRAGWPQRLASSAPDRWLNPLARGRWRRGGRGLRGSFWRCGRPGGEAPSVLEPAEHAPDDVAAFVGGLVERIGRSRVALAGMMGSTPRSLSQVLRPSASAALSASRRLSGARVSSRSLATPMSAMSPGVGVKATRARATAWIASPFEAPRRAVDLDVGGVDGALRGNAAAGANASSIRRHTPRMLQRLTTVVRGP